MVFLNQQTSVGGALAPMGAYGLRSSELEVAKIGGDFEDETRPVFGTFDQ